MLSPSGDPAAGAQVLLFDLTDAWLNDPSDPSLPAGIDQAVVCMQSDRDIPTRGAGCFSRPKSPRDAVQLCQRDCVLNETDNIQGCVWECESSAEGN